MTRPYSKRFTARRNARRYLLSGIPPTLWARAKAKAKREGIAMRSLLLQLLDGWANAEQRDADEAKARHDLEAWMRFLRRHPGFLDATEQAIDDAVVAQAGDDTAWEAPVVAPPVSESVAPGRRRQTAAAAKGAPR